MNWLRSSFCSSLLAVGGLVALLSLSGCSEYKYVAVKGKVTVKNKPVTRGQVTFVPDGANTLKKFPRGKIGPDGTYELETEGHWGVPVGSYTLQVLKNMNLSASVQKNVVSQETDVREVLAKVSLGEVDAGFVYSTDAKTVAKKVLVVKIPAWAQPKVQYGICVVSSSPHKSAAKAFVKRVLSRAGQKKLHQFGFLARVKR